MLRLTAREALEMPVFDDFRGTKLPYSELKPQAYRFEKVLNTYYDDDLRNEDSIQSLESKSRANKLFAEGGFQSNHTVRYEGGPFPVRPAQGFQNTNQSHFSREFQPCYLQDSCNTSTFRNGSQVSWRDKISPLMSPQAQQRTLKNQLSDCPSLNRPSLGYPQTNSDTRQFLRISETYSQHR